jgi:hypothetical protein
MAAGGISTLAGVRYELQAVMFHVPDLLRGEIAELRYQLPALTMKARDVAPAPAFLNDFSIRDRAGRKFFYQVKHRTTTSGWTINALAREGVILQMFLQHKTSPEATLGFISNIQAPALSQLIQAAKEHANVREFLVNLPKRQKLPFGGSAHPRLQNCRDTHCTRGNRRTSGLDQVVGCGERSRGLAGCRRFRQERDYARPADDVGESGHSRPRRKGGSTPIDPWHIDRRIAKGGSAIER